MHEQIAAGTVEASTTVRGGQTPARSRHVPPPLWRRRSSVSSAWRRAAARECRAMASSSKPIASAPAHITGHATARSTSLTTDASRASRRTSARNCLTPPRTAWRNSSVSSACRTTLSRLRRQRVEVDRAAAECRVAHVRGAYVRAASDHLTPRNRNRVLPRSSATGFHSSARFRFVGEHHQTSTISSWLGYALG